MTYWLTTLRLFCKDEKYKKVSFKGHFWLHLRLLSNISLLYSSILDSSFPLLGSLVLSQHLTRERHDLKNWIFHTHWYPLTYLVNRCVQAVDCMNIYMLTNSLQVLGRARLECCISGPICVYLCIYTWHSKSSLLRGCVHVCVCVCVCAGGATDSWYLSGR